MAGQNQPRLRQQGGKRLPGTYPFLLTPPSRAHTETNEKHRDRICQNVMLNRRHDPRGLKLHFQQFIRQITNSLFVFSHFVRNCIRIFSFCCLLGFKGRIFS